MPAASQSTSNSPISKATNEGLSNGAKAGIGIGVAILALALIGGAVFFIIKRKQRSKRESQIPLHQVDKKLPNPDPGLLQVHEAGSREYMGKVNVPAIYEAPEYTFVGHGPVELDARRE